MENNIDLPEEVKLYPNKRATLNKQKTELIMQIKKNQQELQGLVDEYNKVQAKLEFLDEIENNET